MIVVGDADSVRTAHAVEFFELLGGGKADAGWDGSGMSNARLAILPAMTHYNIFFSPLLASTVTYHSSTRPCQRANEPWKVEAWARNLTEGNRD